MSAVLSLLTSIPIVAVGAHETILHATIVELSVNDLLVVNNAIQAGREDGRGIRKVVPYGFHRRQQGRWRIGNFWQTGRGTWH